MSENTIRLIREQADGSFAEVAGLVSGNARGANSVDLCAVRSNVAYVCAGVNSGAVGGEDVGGTGTHTFYAAGQSNYNNTGTHCSISGQGNYGNSGTHCSISGNNNYSNSGYDCLISGQANHTNIGHGCSISGYNNSSNSGSYCSISGSGNYGNSGNNCSISGSGNHTNSGYDCSISGQYNTSNSGAHCSISGYNNYGNSGTHCAISGNNNHSNSGTQCLISGANAANNSLSYARVHGGNSNARIIDLVAQIDSSGTGATELLLGGTGGTRIIIPDQSAWMFDIHFVAKTDTGANAKMGHRTGVIVRDGAATSISTVNTVGTDQEIGTTNATFGVAADDTNEALQLTVTASSGTVRCVARIHLTQVDY